MGTNRWYTQFMIFFSVMMTIFYIGIGLYFIFSSNLTQIDKFIRYLVGGTFVFYGIYRLYRTSIQVYDEFFSGKYKNE